MHENRNFGEENLKNFLTDIMVGNDDTHFSNQRCELKKNNGLFIFAPVFTYDVNNSKIWVQFFYLYGLARKCHFCILTMFNQLISGLKKNFYV